MADPLEVCEAIIERLDPILSDWDLLVTEPQPPAIPPLPYAVVELAPTKGADHVQVHGDWTKWSVQIVLNASATDWEASLREMAPLLGTKGPIHTALKDVLDDYDDTLSRLSRGNVQVAMLSGFRLVKKNKQPVRTATITVTVGTN